MMTTLFNYSIFKERPKKYIRDDPNFRTLGLLPTNSFKNQNKTKQNKNILTITYANHM